MVPTDEWTAADTLEQETLALLVAAFPAASRGKEHVPYVFVGQTSDRAGLYSHVYCCVLDLAGEGEAD